MNKSKRAPENLKLKIDDKVEDETLVSCEKVPNLKTGRKVIKIDFRKLVWHENCKYIFVR